MDLTRRSSDRWIVDYGDRSEEEAAYYSSPYAWIRERVKPVREQNARLLYRQYWWRHAEGRPGLKRNLEGLSRFIATPMVAKHRVFAWVSANVLPSNLLNVVARDDDMTFGILHSRFHELWALRLGTWLVPETTLVILRRQRLRLSRSHGG